MATRAAKQPGPAEDGSRLPDRCNAAMTLPATRPGLARRLSAMAGRPYLRGMKSLRFFSLLLAASATLLLTASCAQEPDAEKDPKANAEYKRAHRTEMYREAQRSNVNY